MEKYLVEVCFPAAEQKYDVFIPAAAMLHEVLTMLVAMAPDLSGGRYTPGADAVLCSDSGEILDINMTVDALGIRNGSQLMLI